MGKKRISDEEGLNILKKCIDEMGYIPTLREYDKLNYIPKSNWYLRRFGSFDVALMKIGINILSKSKIMELTKDDLVKILKDKYKELGKSPASKEIRNPTSNVFYSRFGTMSWNEILKECGLPYNHYEWSTKEAINSYKDLYYKLGRLPTKYEIDNLKITPASDWFYHKGLTIEKFYYQIGLIDKPLTSKDRIDISIKELIKLANILNKCPTVEEFESIKHNGYQRRNLEDNLNMKYNDICRKYIPQYNLNINHDITNEEVYESINKMVDEYGYILPYQNYKNLTYSYSYNVFNHLFNKTYGEVVESLGYNMYGTTTKQKTEDELLEEYLELFNKLQRVPTVEEVNLNISSYSTYINKFKTIKNICDILNIDCYIYNKNSNKRILFDKNNELCRSIPELEISNYFIDNNIEYKKETKYKEILEREQNRKVSRRLDWTIKFNNITYYIEYFGLYEWDSKTKTSKRYIKKLRKRLRIYIKKV